MRSTLRILLLALSALSVTGTAFGAGQRKVPAYEKYIKQYSNLAIQHQKKFHIPASITLAQGLLESGAGQSELARKSIGGAAVSTMTTTCVENVSANTRIRNSPTKTMPVFWSTVPVTPPCSN